MLVKLSNFELPAALKKLKTIISKIKIINEPVPGPKKHRKIQAKFEVISYIS